MEFVFTECKLNKLKRHSTTLFFDESSEISNITMAFSERNKRHRSTFMLLSYYRDVLRRMVARPNKASRPPIVVSAGADTSLIGALALLALMLGSS
jgi:hypothetical protein